MHRQISLRPQPQGIRLRPLCKGLQVESGVGRVPIEMQGAWAEALGHDPGEFARTLLRHYEPELHRLLFLTTKGESSGARASGGKG